MYIALDKTMRTILRLSIQSFRLLKTDFQSRWSKFLNIYCPVMREEVTFNWKLIIWVRSGLDNETWYATETDFTGVEENVTMMWNCSGGRNRSPTNLCRLRDIRRNGYEQHENSCLDGTLLLILSRTMHRTLWITNAARSSMQRTSNRITTIDLCRLCN